MEFLKELGIDPQNSGTFAGNWISSRGEDLVSYSPIHGKEIARVKCTEAADYEKVVNKLAEGFLTLREMPAPARGEIVRQIGQELRQYKTPLGKLVSLEMGKILAEGLGEVQEMIDMADFAVGLSRQVYGLTLASERKYHHMRELWHPLGVVGVITAFNFPVAVWAWNAFLSLVCGNATLWKPSSKTPLTAIAVQNIVNKVLIKNDLPPTFGLVIGPGKSVGDLMLSDRRIPLVSATGSCDLGQKVAIKVGTRLGRTILELGGNNAVIVMKSASIDLALRAVLFGAIGTAGQRCTSTRRLIVDKEIAALFQKDLIAAYRQIKIGNPLDSSVLMGPLVDREAVNQMQSALKKIREQGGVVLCGGEVLGDSAHQSGCYVVPAIVQAKPALPMMKEETFAPILYLVETDSFEEAIALQNDVRQGLSSSLFTQNLIEAETFLSARGSDCGIANVNTGTSGAEIGGAFGGEKDTGGGREAGSDSWKQYMRRQSAVVNWGSELPLAQGIEFGE
jgi:aldehyde dehydrogenase (NAD+)